jgi:putative two-component system response regulator
MDELSLPSRSRGTTERRKTDDRTNLLEDRREVIEIQKFGMPEELFDSAMILVADDDTATRDLLSVLLKVQGYRVFCAQDGQEALDFLLTHDPAVALLDVMMPKLTGFEVCLAAKANPETRLIPIVLLTGLSSTDDRIRGITCGADDFLNKPVNEEELVARVKSLVRLKGFTNELESAERVLFSLVLSIEAKDPYTKEHCNRLSTYSVALAERLQLPSHLCRALHLAGIVHDVGKVAIPEQILLKAGPLTPEERKVMEQHPLIGERICAPLKSLRHVLPIIRHHHEKLDGSGYPDGLKGEEIPLTARILQIVDIYDALATDRPYRKAIQPEEVFSIMHEEAKRGWWDDSLICELQSIMMKTP